jgi:hypothetical protein
VVPEGSVPEVSHVRFAGVEKLVQGQVFVRLG